MTILTCQCCGHSEDFRTGEQAFWAGWDAPPHFTTHVCCPLCPAVCVVMGAGHRKAHKLWEIEGRPAEFTLDKCATDAVFGNTEAIAKTEMGMAQVEALFKRKH